MINKSATELKFETELINYLTQIGGVKQWEYMSNIKTDDDLWNNFKNILERNNQERLNLPLSVTEFNQVKRTIEAIETPYKAGQFLHGVNGISQIEVDLDDGRHVFLTVFDQGQVGGGNTVYQVVNQIERKQVIDGKGNRRFDVTLLINGLPIIQIELKKALHSTTESLNQMKQYIAEKQYTGIFSTLQVLVAMTPYDVKYMANATLRSFNTDFAFNWQDEKDARPIRSWKEFADSVLSIPMAHDLTTRYMILDGTKNKESIKVMRPYQVYATKRALDKVKKYDFKYGDGKLGYIWHTTGSGKTITSFKTAWLASRLSNVDKVVFLVDRIALTNQTVEAYQAYDPVSSFEGKSGVVNETANISDLHKKFTKKSDSNIIVTSIQKMARYTARDSFSTNDKKVLFIVDEAHRSTGDGNSNEGMLENIRKKIPNAAWIGYTGTPRFPETKNIFGEPLHIYTIKEAIADKNVLGFKVQFKETIDRQDDATEEEIDDNIKASVYDTSEKHVDLVIKDIFDNWKSRSNDRKYNALFTVHVGGNKPSIPRAMEYFDKMIEENEKRLPQDRLKIAISFSSDTSNSDSQLNTNTNLHRAIKYYNDLFGTVFDMTTVRQYSEDLVRRLNKTSYDQKYLDLVIVVDQLLTGFDAPELNTLYVDRTLKDGNLIQAYSRTNRIHNNIDKQYGNIINYRWPKQNEEGMNKAFAIYSNRDSASSQLTLEELKNINKESGILSGEFTEVKGKLQKVITDLSELTENFTITPPSEIAKDKVFEGLHDYNKYLSQLKQFTVDDDNNEISVYNNPEEFYKQIGITEDEELMLVTVIAEEIKRDRAKREVVDISHIALEMVHIRDIRINYDYLVDLIAKMADQVKENKMEEAATTELEIKLELAKSDNEHEKGKIRKFISKIFNKEFEFDSYPVIRDVDYIYNAINTMQNNENIKLITNFIRKWGLDNTIKPKELEKIISKHRYGEDDMNKQQEITNIMNEAKDYYPAIANDIIKEYSWIKYRKELRYAINELADYIKKGE